MKNYLNSSIYNISLFKKLNDDGLLNMKPLFQRDIVWTDKQKSYLMDSVLRGYPIPEIYLQEQISTTGESKFIVVDGQQRISSILAYINDEYAIDESESETWANFEFSDLSESDKKNFFGYKFIVRLLPEMDDEEIRAIFKRINKNNVALNKQELRHATYSGAFISLINDISDRSYWQELGIFSQAKIRRMLDAEYISEMAIAFLNGHQNKKDKLDYYYTMYEDSFDDNEILSNTFDTVCNEIIKMLPNIRKTRWNKMVDFYTLFLVLATYQNTFPLASEIRKKVSDALIAFGEYVTSIQSGDFNSLFSDNIKNYATGIRNSSDIGSRKQRFISLNKELSTIIN
jgi:hypothetical protein